MITVAICTYNREKSLAVALASLAAQRGVDEPWELLLVDNNCTDSTRELARSFEGRLPLRWIPEASQGLSQARNRALAEARGNLLVFTDDDVRLDSAWLHGFSAAAGRFPEVELFAGRILADWEGEPPRWYREKTAYLFDGVIVGLDLGTESRLLGRADPLPVGASFGMRRSLFERNGAFRTDLGVKGGDSGRGEESEYSLRALRAGALGAYVGEAICWHPVDRDRLRLPRLFRYGIASGIAYRRVQAPEVTGSLARAWLFLARGAVQLLKGRGDHFRRCILNSGIEIGIRRAARASELP